MGNRSTQAGIGRTLSELIRGGYTGTVPERILEKPEKVPNAADML